MSPLQLREKSLLFSLPVPYPTQKKALVACLKMLEGHIIGVHAKDINEFGNVKAKNVESGKGVIDFNAVYKELQRQRFKGVMHIECEYNFDNNLQDVINARSYLLGLKP